MRRVRTRDLPPPSAVSSDDRDITRATDSSFGRHSSLVTVDGRHFVDRANVTVRERGRRRITMSNDDDEAKDEGGVSDVEVSVRQSTMRLARA